MFLESLDTVQEIKQVFYMKPHWGKKEYEINVDNLIEMRNLAIKLRREELENEANNEPVEIPEDKITVEYIQKIKTVKAMRDIFKIKEHWKRSHHITFNNITLPDLEKYKALAIQCKQEETAQSDSTDIYTLQYIERIDTVKHLKQMFRAKEHWMKNRDVKYKHITTATLEKFRKIAIECKLEDMKQLQVNTGFKPIVSRINDRPEVVKLTSQDDLKNIQLPIIPKLQVTPMAALKISQQQVDQKEEREEREIIEVSQKPTISQPLKLKIIQPLSTPPPQNLRLNIVKS